MSSALVAAEIKRFLASSEPEVLCIKGKWGVGKTFAWLNFLREARHAGQCALSQYSYVTLFGINSLDDLRYAVVEGTVPPEHFLTGPTLGTISNLAKQVVAKTRTLADIGYGFFGKKDGGAAIARAAFLLVRNQLICFDDLERAGNGLQTRDVLGLAASLKEQRRCKVVLLLNDEQMEENQRSEFERQLEKVVDVALVFDPTSPEAATIALQDADPISALLRERIVKLGIVNIRVIKKIERLARRLTDLLHGLAQPIIDQAVSTVTVGGWAVLQPDDAPDLKFLRSFNTLTYALRKGEGEALEADQRWKVALDGYPFLFADELDHAIFDGVERGYFDESTVMEAARIVEQRLVDHPESNTFSKAWEQFHGSLTLDDNQVLGDIYRGAMENVGNINAMSMNGTICLFRQMGLDEQANQLLAAYVEAHAGDRSFFVLQNHHFMADDQIDPALVATFRDQLERFVDQRDPQQVLLDITRSSSWNDVDVKLLAKLTCDAWIQLFDSIQGSELPRALEMAQRLVPHAGENREAFEESLQSALKAIADRSPLRAYRMRRFGIRPPTD